MSRVESCASNAEEYLINSEYTFLYSIAYPKRETEIFVEHKNRANIELNFLPRRRRSMDLIDKAKKFVSEKIENMEKPEATITDVDLKRIGFDGVSFHAKVAVKNPYSVPIPIMEIDYVLKSATRVIASGKIPDPGSIKANDSTMLDVPVKVPHSVLVSLVRDIGGDWDIDYTLELGLIIDIPVVGNITIPLSYSGEYKLPTLSDLWKGKDEEEKKEKEEEEKEDPSKVIEI